MIRAYDETYLRLARASLARAFDYAVYDEHLALEEFCSAFLSSGVARRFERGDAGTLAGKSGVELARDVLSSLPDYQPSPARYTASRTPEYWAGWALAYYQWQSGLPFERILRAVPINSILLMYGKFHEMDITQFADHMDGLMRDSEPTSRLKELRMRTGISQRELAVRSGVPLRSVQQYEQRQKNINRASFESVVALARAVYCPDPTDLLEV